MTLRKMCRVSLVVIVVVVCLTSIRVAGMTKSIPAAEEERLVKIAIDYVKENIPGWEIEKLKLPHIVIDRNETWVVTYVLPDGVLGGVPVVVIDKKSLKVVQAYHTQ